MPPHHGTKHAAPAGTAAAVLMVIISAASAFAAVPADLTNFQNEYPCDQGATLIVRYDKSMRQLQHMDQPTVTTNQGGS